MAGPFDIYDEVIDKAYNPPSPQLSGSIYSSADTSPDAEATLHKLSKKTGIPLEGLRNDNGDSAPQFSCYRFMAGRS